MRPAAMLYFGCVLALAAGGGLLGIRLLQAGTANGHAHAGLPGIGVPARTSFGSVDVESVQQIRGLTPKALAGVTHGIHSLVKADQMQVQIVLLVRNERNRAIGYDPGQYVLRLVRAGSKSKGYASVTTSVRAGRLSSRSAMETTIGFVIPRFNRTGTRLALELREHGREPLTLDLGRVRPGGSFADARAALRGAHQH